MLRSNPGLSPKTPISEPLSPPVQYYRNLRRERIEDSHHIRQYSGENMPLPPIQHYRSLSNERINETRRLIDFSLDEAVHREQAPSRR